MAPPRQRSVVRMSKAQRAREQSARARIAAQQAEQRRKDQRRRMIAIGGAAVVLLAVIGIIIAALVSRSSPPSRPAASSSPLPAGVQANLTVPTGTLATVGIGSSSTQLLKSVTGPALVSGGKPEMLYIGAEWCPFCAAERWAMAVALSRFGTFSPLRGVHSSSSDVYPNTATLTFYHSTYTSKYLVFTPVENQDVNHNLLQAPTAAQKALWAKYQPPGDTYPFINFGNRAIAAVTYNPQVLQGLTWSQIAADLHNPSSPVAKGAVGSANLFTAAICNMTGNQPAGVCNAAPVAALRGQI
jgi:thiol-disulfide isomerase/thioredoxin